MYPLRANRGAWTLGAPFRGAQNASYGAWSNRHRLHYLVDEQREGTIGAFRYRDGLWCELARVPTGGAEPCYVSLSADEYSLAVANYGSGSIAVIRLDPASGLPCEPARVRQNHGHGANPERQEGPHAHCAVFSPDGRWLYQTDLGTDQVLAHRYDPARGLQGTRRVAFKAPAGSGPRHLVFHPHQPLVLLVSELASTLTVLDVGDGLLSERSTVPTIPTGFDGTNLAGHLALNAAGDRALVTNRGHDSIAQFAFEQGSLTLLGRTDSGGASPRFLLHLEEQRALFVANQEGNNVTVFEVERDGTMTQTGQVAAKGAAYVFAAAPD